MSDILNEKEDNDGVDLTTSRKRGRPSKNRNPETDDVDDQDGHDLSTGSMNGSVAKQKVQTGPRGRARRKVITPMKFAMDQIAGEAGNSISPNSRHERALKAKPGNASPPKETVRNKEGFKIYSDGQGYRVPALRSRAFAKGPVNVRQQSVEIATSEVSGQESLLEKKDEAMWRSMIRPSFRSPQPVQPSPSADSEVGEVSLDPTDNHHEFDSIMESEGFSMISTSSLPSAGQHGQGSMETSHTSASASTKAQTPVKPSVPSAMPPPPVPPKIAESDRSLNAPTSGTPKLLRVVQAGNALNGAIEPPEAVESSLSKIPQDNHLESEHKARSSSDDVFVGFGAGTRRELRAGLRLGEELAKRYSAISSGNNEANKEVFKGGNSDHRLYPRLPTPESQPEQYAVIQQTQLPSPDESEVLEDQMSWKANSPAKSDSPSESQHSGSQCSSHFDQYPVDDTIMREREMQWQREREAVSKEIDMANSGQVIVIDSGDEDGEEDDEEEHRVEDEEDYDIWQEEANSFEKPYERTQGSNIGLPQKPVKPFRSKLPSPWRRSSQLLYSDELNEAPDNPSPPRRDSNDRSDNNAAPLEMNVVSNPSPIVKQESALSTPALLSDIPEVTPAARSSVFSSGKPNPMKQDITQLRQPQCTPPVDQIERRSNTDKQHSFTAYPSPEASSSSLSQEANTSMTASVSKERSLQNPAQLVISRTTVEDSRRTLFGNPVISALEKSTLTSAAEQVNTKKRNLDTRSPQASHIKSCRSRSVEAKTDHLSAGKKPSRAPIAPKAQPSSLTQPSSFLDRLTSVLPTFSFHIPFAVSPPYPIPRNSVDGGPLPRTPLYSHLPWTHAHFAYLYPYYSVARKDPQAYPFDSKSPHAYLVGQIMHNQCGWSKPCEAWEIGVVERFLLLLQKYGRRRDHPSGDVPHLCAEKPNMQDERPIERKDIAVKIFQLWVGGVVRGECEVGKGTTGEVLEGDRVGEKWEWPRDRWADGKREGRTILEWGRLEL